MLNRLAFLSLVSLLVSSTADARRVRPIPIFEVETVASETHAKITAEHIWSTGDWTVEDFRQKVPKTTTGRLTDDQLRALRAELAKAPWQHTYSQPPCARPHTETRYSVDGKVVYSEPACGDALDETSQRVLAYARGFVDGALVVPATAPSCEPAGAPLVALANRAETLTVYRNGAVMRKTGKQCLAQNVADRIAADLAAATWKQTPVVHCMMKTTDQTTVTVGGRVVFVEQACNPYKLDDASAKSLADIEQLVGWAQPAPPPPPPPTCEVSGAPLIVLANKADTVTVYRSGALVRKAGKECLAQDVVDRIAADLAAAAWKPTPVVHCMMKTTDQTTVTVGGRVVFVEQACNPYKLDDASARSLADIEQLVGWAQPGQPPPPPPPPPACEVSGAPLVELADNAHKLTVYRTGAVTNSPNNGSKRATTKQCIAQDVVDKIAADLAAASWKQTPVVHCMMMTGDQTTVTVGGKVVFTERVCNPVKLDEASAKSLADIEKLLGWVQPPASGASK